RSVRVLLRLGLFQLAFLDRVPAYAAVDTTVTLAAQIAPRARGLVNAVLRRASREGLAPPPEDDRERLAVELSHPPWLIEHFERELGSSEARALLEASNRPAPTVLRALADRDVVIEELRRRGLEARPARYAPEAVLCSIPVAEAGLAVPQGEASQLVTLLAGAAAGDRVLDACAAPGGKTAYLARLVGSRGRVVAVDPARGARRRILDLAALAGAANVEALASPIQQFAADSPFDVVVVDAPCSGLGTLAEHPEIRWRRRPGDIAAFAERQREILDAAARLVRPGGRLVYCTCTLAREENDGVVDDFLGRHGEFDEIVAPPPQPCFADFVDGAGRFRSFPHRHGVAGFFAARLERKA
ncbi:MAG: methyltransferase domain-containing protein, partial [Deltaproteobacteria bacterium]